MGNAVLVVCVLIFWFIVWKIISVNKPKEINKKPKKSVNKDNSIKVTGPYKLTDYKVVSTNEGRSRDTFIKINGIQFKEFEKVKVFYKEKEYDGLSVIIKEHPNEIKIMDFYGQTEPLDKFKYIKKK